MIKIKIKSIWNLTEIHDNFSIINSFYFSRFPLAKILKELWIVSSNCWFCCWKKMRTNKSRMQVDKLSTVWWTMFWLWKEKSVCFDFFSFFCFDFFFLRHEQRTNVGLFDNFVHVRKSSTSIACRSCGNVATIFGNEMHSKFFFNQFYQSVIRRPADFHLKSILNQ